MALHHVKNYTEGGLHQPNLERACYEVESAKLLPPFNEPLLEAGLDGLERKAIYQSTGESESYENLGRALAHVG